MSGNRSHSFYDLFMDSSSEEDEVETSSEEVDGKTSSEEEGDKSSNPEFVVVAVEKNYASDSETERTELVKNPGPSAAKKRSSDGEASASTDGKRVKNSDGGEETKKTFSQRVWSDDDEIKVLQGMIDNKTVDGVSPFDDANEFYLVVKNYVSFNVSITQLTKKLTELKKKFEDNLGRGKNGEEPTFSMPHDRKAFDLSKLIWGDHRITPQSVMKSNKKSNKVESVKQEVVSSLCVNKNIEKIGKVSSLGGMVGLDTTSIFVGLLARFGLDDVVAQQGWTALASEDKKKFEEQWKAMQLKELEMCSEKTAFIHKVITKMGEAFRSNP